EASDLRNLTAGFMTFLIAGLLVAASLVAALLGPLVVQPAVIVFSALLIGSLMLFGVAIQDLRSRRRTGGLGAVTFAKAALSLVFGALGAWAYGYAGALGAEILVNLTLFAALSRLVCQDFRFRADEFRRLRPIMRIGIPLGLKNAMNHLSLTLDRWCIVVTLGVAALGQYSFAMLLVSAGLAVHATIWVHLGPQAAFAYGRDEDLRALFRSLNLLAGGVLLVFVLGAVPFTLVVESAVPRYFPEYQAGGKLLPILYWGACFQILAQYEWVAMALKRTGPLFWAACMATTMTALLYGVAAWLGAPLATFAWIFVVGRALNAAGQLVAARVAARLGVAETSARLLEPGLVGPRGI